MKLALISPTDLLTSYGNLTDYHMALTHLVETDVSYANFYRAQSKKGHYVILDNSVIELGDSVHIERLLQAALKVDADELILPDVLDDKEATYQKAMECAEIMRSHPFTKRKHIQVMAVPQGRDLAEFIASYKQLAAEKFIDVIGIPKRCGRFMDTENGTGRVQVIKHMVQNSIIDQYRPHHLLGVHDNPLEIYQLNHFDFIRGVDTQLPFWAAHVGIRFHKTLGMLERRAGRNILLEDKTVALAEDDLNHNILCMLRWANNNVVRGY